jgi:hypothetical protein
VTILDRESEGEIPRFSFWGIFLCPFLSMATEKDEKSAT